MFYMWGCLDAPYVHPLYICTPPYVYMPLGCTHTQYVPILLCATVCSQRLLYVVGVVRAPYMLGVSFMIPPVWVCLSFGLHPHSSLASPCISMFGDICMLYGEYFPYVGGLGVFPHLLGVLGHQHLGCPYVYSCTFLQFIRSHVSIMATTTTPPVTVVSSGLSSVSSVTVAPSLVELPVTLDQGGVVQPPPLMPKGSGGVIGTASVPQQQPPSLMPLLAYANHAMGSPQVSFFFRVEPPTIVYIICLVSILLSAFYF